MSAWIRFLILVSVSRLSLSPHQHLSPSSSLSPSLLPFTSLVFRTNVFLASSLATDH